MIYESNTRMTGVRFSPDMKVIFFSERAGQNTVDYAVYLAEPAQRYTLARYRADDVYANPGSIVGVRGGGGGGGAARCWRRARRRRRRRRPGAAVGRRQQRLLPGHGLRQEPERGRPEDVHRQGRDQDRREEADLREREQATSSSACPSMLDIDAGQFIVARESPTEVPQQYLLRTAGSASS